MPKNKHPNQLENVLDILLAYSSDIIILLATDFTITQLNTSAEKFYNWSLEEVCGENFLQLCQALDYTSPISAGFFDQATSLYINLDSNNSVGKKCNINWAVCPITSADNHVTGAMIIGKDVEFKKNNIAYHLNGIINAIPGFLYWKNLNGLYLGCNDFTARIAGLSSSHEVVGKTDWDLWGEEAKRLIEHDKQVINSQEAVLVEEELKDSDGRWISFAGVKMPLRDENNQIIGIIGNSIDITELKNTRSQLRETEERLAGIRSLSASIAHELRTPLSTIKFGINAAKDYFSPLIKGYQLAKEHHLKVSPIRDKHLEMLSELFDNIESEVEYSNTIINMILMNVKQNGFQIADFKKCSMAHCISEALRRYPFKQEEIKLVEWSEGKDFLFKGDEMLMIHVLFNLIRNALYFIEAEKKGKVEIRQDSNENSNVLYFKDTARGIPAEVLPKLFEKFYTTTRHGTGLGLAFCKMVMTSFGGRITCESEYGEFTQFELFFPKIQDETAA